MCIYIIIFRYVLLYLEIGRKKSAKKKEKGKEELVASGEQGARMGGVRGLGSAVFLCKLCTVTFPNK